MNLPYDAIERDLETLCEVWKVSTMEIRSLSKSLKVARVCVICGEPFFPKVHNQQSCSRPCHEELNRRLCRKSSYAYWLRKRAERLANPQEEEPPFIPITERFDRACRSKAKHLGMSMSTFSAVWLSGSAGQRWAEQIAVVPHG